MMLGGIEDGTFRIQRAAFYRCRAIDGASVTCTPESEPISDGCSTNDQKLTDLSQIDDLRLVGTLDRGGLVVGARSSPTDTWQLGCFSDVRFLSGGLERNLGVGRR